MQIEIYNMLANDENLNITLEAICDSFSSLLWDIEYYQCGSFEMYIAANPRNIEIFKTGRIVGRDNDWGFRRYTAAISLAAFHPATQSLASASSVM